MCVVCSMLIFEDGEHSLLTFFLKVIDFAYLYFLSFMICAYYHVQSLRARLRLIGPFLDVVHHDSRDSKTPKEETKV